MAENISNKVHLIVYPDSFGKNLKELHYLLNKYFKKEIRGVHILPFYPSSADRGFSPLTHSRVEEKFGTWEDISNIAKEYELMADLIVNHVSTESKYFKDYIKRGKHSKYRNFFVSSDSFSKRIYSNSKSSFFHKAIDLVENIIGTLRHYDPIFHKDGVNRFILRKIYRPRPGSPFVSFKFADGSSRKLWCTFSPEQIDLNIKSRGVRRKIKRDITNIAKNGCKIIRLDAVGYIGKQRGTDNFLIKESFNFIKWMAKIAHNNGAVVLPEIHYYYKAQFALAKAPGIDYVYDFVLPFLLLHTLFMGDNKALVKWIKIRPSNVFTTLDTHDGIGVIDVEGLLSEKEIEQTSQMIYLQGGNATHRASGKSSKNVDIYQLNTTYYSALGKNDDAYLAARAIQFFLPGIPQVYYVGLLAGENDIERLDRTGIGRDINRHTYEENEIVANLERPVVKRLLKLIRFRNKHQAFSGDFEMLPSEENNLILSWRKNEHYCCANIDLKSYECKIEYSDQESDNINSQII